MYVHRVLDAHIAALDIFLLLLLSVARSDYFPRLTPSCWP